MLKSSRIPCVLAGSDTSCRGTSALRACGCASVIRGEHGRSLGEDAPGRSRALLRCGVCRGLAGQQDEEEVSGLEEEAATRQTIRDAEENRPGLKGTLAPHALVSRPSD